MRTPTSPNPRRKMAPKHPRYLPRFSNRHRRALCRCLLAQMVYWQPSHTHSYCHASAREDFVYTFRLQDRMWNVAITILGRWHASEAWSRPSMQARVVRPPTGQTINNCHYHCLFCFRRHLYIHTRDTQKHLPLPLLVLFSSPLLPAHSKNN